MAAYQDRMSIRGHHAHLRGVLRDGVALGGGKKRRPCYPAFVDTLLPAENGDVLELDELWSFIGAVKPATTLAVGGLVPTHPPDRGLDVG